MIGEATRVASEDRAADLALTFGYTAPRTPASYERELTKHRRVEQDLREALAHEEAVGDESVHRLLNGLQMIASLLSLQSRASASPEIGSQLAMAASRVTMISSIHRRLQSLEGRKTVAFKQFLEELCRDYRAMLSCDERPEAIVIDGPEMELPTTIAVPLALIANELITNAAKKGQGRITVTLEKRAGGGRALSVRNDGSPLPKDFTPAASKGPGMKIVRTFVAQIGGQLRFAPGEDGDGAQFTVLFPQ